MSEYPEHEKLKAVKDDSHKIGEFLEWLRSQGWVLAQWDNDELTSIGYTTGALLAEYFKIDPRKLEEEKQMMIERLRRGTG